MENQDFDRLECEANGHTPYHLLRKEKAERVAKLLDLQTREQMGELEAGQYFGPSILPYSPINTLR
jgi:hypothetical protein